MKNNYNKKYCVFILTNNRPNKVVTINTLKNQGYTGDYKIILDNEDKTKDKYIQNFGKENVVIFDKEKISKTFDEFDNFKNRKSIVYARNAVFEIAKKLNYKNFIQLDDDYTGFYYKLIINNKAINKKVLNLDLLFNNMFIYYNNINAKSIAFAQGGDFIGGIDNGFGRYRFSKRKCMNSFFCSTDKKFNFIGRINEDVNTYTHLQSKGNLFLTISPIALIQKQTQSSNGGMTDLYKNNGTYIKSFYTIICSPSCSKISMMKTSNSRLHHKIKWDNVAPMIIKEKYKK